MDEASIEAAITALQAIVNLATATLVGVFKNDQVALDTIARCNYAMATYSNVIQQMRIKVILANIPHAPGVIPA